jgi:hypothetical protein
MARIERPDLHFHHDAACPTPALEPEWEPWSDDGWRRLCERCRVLQYLLRDPNRSAGRAGSRCDRHGRRRQSPGVQAAYDNPVYRRNRAALIAEHLRRHGEVCPGAPDLGHAPHPCRSGQLTADHHPVPRALGGSADRSNLRVLCRRRNLSAGAELGVRLGRRAR